LRWDGLQCLQQRQLRNSPQRDRRNVQTTECHKQNSG
jgi:hypothetical protein